jgi:hypothetical protein
MAQILAGSPRAGLAAAYGGPVRPGAAWSGRLPMKSPWSPYAAFVFSYLIYSKLGCG